MTFLAAAFWNHIAETHDLETEAGKIAFRMNPDQLAKLDDVWMRFEKIAKTPENVARCLPTCLPLLAEADAVNQYVSQYPQMRNAIPEILSPEDAATLMQLEWRMSDEDAKTLQSVLSSPEAIERWEMAARTVSECSVSSRTSQVKSLDPTQIAKRQQEALELEIATKFAETLLEFSMWDEFAEAVDRKTYQGMPKSQQQIEAMPEEDQMEFAAKLIKTLLENQPWIVDQIEYLEKDEEDRREYMMECAGALM